MRRKNCKKKLSAREKQVQELSQQNASLRIFVNEANAKFQTESTLRNRLQNELNKFRTQVQTLAKEKKLNMEKIQRFQEEARQSNLKSRLAENEVRKYSREVSELQSCKIKLEKFEKMIEKLSMENLEMQKRIASLSRTLVNERKQARAMEERGPSGSVADKEDLTVTSRGELRKVSVDPSEGLQSAAEDVEAHAAYRPSIEDYLLMSAQAVKVQYAEVDISAEQLVQIARGVKFWEVHNFMVNAVKSLKMKEDSTRGPLPFVSRLKSWFSPEDGHSSSAI